MPTVGRSGPNSPHVQTLVFSSSIWTEPRARAWCKAHGYISRGYHRATGAHRYRQYDPQPDKFAYRLKPRKGGPEGLKLNWGIPHRQVRSKAQKRFWRGVL